MGNIDTVIDTETISTNAGDYVVSWFYDDYSESPLQTDDAGVQFYIVGGRYNDVHVDTTSGAAGDALVSLILAQHNWNDTGGSDVDGIVRRYQKWRAITGSPWQLFTGSGNGRSQGHWWNWYLLIDTTAGFIDAERAASAIMDEYESWASGEVYTFDVVGPDGDSIESVGSFIGDDGRKHALIDYVRPAIDYDVEQRQKNANVVGAGFVGLI